LSASTPHFLRIVCVSKVMTWTSGLRVILCLSFITTFLTLFPGYKKVYEVHLHMRYLFFFLHGIYTDCKLDLETFWLQNSTCPFLSPTLNSLECYMLWLIPCLLWKPLVCCINIFFSYGIRFSRMH
jgi:hypothetical protein